MMADAVRYLTPRGDAGGERVHRGIALSAAATGDRTFPSRRRVLHSAHSSPIRAFSPREGGGSAWIGDKCALEPG